MTTSNSNSTRTVDSTASRAELAAISDTDAAAGTAFVAAARNRIGGYHGEALAYVSAVEARGAKRGAKAAVQAAIAKALTGAGLASEVPSATRYSKLAESLAATSAAGLDSSDAEHFGALYALWNVPSAKESKQGALTVAERDAIVAGAKRKRTPDARLAFILAETAKAKAKGPKAPTTPDAPDAPDAPAAESVEVKPLTPAKRTAAILDAIAELYADAESLPDANRVRVAEALRATADTLFAAVVPSDASALTLTDAA
jgi:hypothetical protein